MMRLALLAALALPCLTAGKGNGAAYCATIQDPDQRNYCLALTTKNHAYCSNIRNHDLRALCRAQVP